MAGLRSGFNRRLVAFFDFACRRRPSECCGLSRHASQSESPVEGLRRFGAGLRAAAEDLSRGLVDEFRRRLMTGDAAGVDTSCIGRTQHQPHVLHCSPGGALAEVVATRDQDRLRLLWLAKAYSSSLLVSFSASGSMRPPLAAALSSGTTDTYLLPA
jgi:hypothetical protein